MIKNNAQRAVSRIERMIEAIKQKVPAFVFLVGMVLALFLMYKFYKFVDTYDVSFQQPVRIEVYSPVIIERRPEKPVQVQKIHSPIPEGYEPSPANTSTPTPQAYRKMPNKALEAVNEHVDTLKLLTVSKSRYPHFINHIWIHESTQGTNMRADGLHARCIEKGMSNEFGFYPQGAWCWSTFEEGIARIERWRENEAKGLTDNQALCYYNGAGKVEDCPYLYSDKLSLAH